MSGSSENIPSSATDGGFTYTGGTYSDLLTFVQADKCLADYAGKIIPRNACRGPWTNTLDGKLAIQLPFNKVKAEITLDALNLINLFDSKGGLFRYASFNQIQVITSVPTSVTATAPFTGYNLSTLTGINFTKYFPDVPENRQRIVDAIKVMAARSAVESLAEGGGLKGATKVLMTNAKPGDPP